LFALRLRRTLLIALAAICAALSPAATAAASHPLTMGIAGAPEITGPDSALVLARLRAAGMSRIFIFISWAGIAPQQEPRTWDPANPSDPNYDWSSADAQVRAIAAAGFQPVLDVRDTPFWARLPPAWEVSPPDPTKFGQFMRAAAERYSGKTPGLPRVRYWPIWNEPNISLFLAPQYDFQTGKFTSPDTYRDLVNAAARAIHSVHPDDVVIAGETAPFRDITPDVLARDDDWGPLKFMRRMLCVDDSGLPTCSQTVSFDVWSTHPYTSGGPTHHAAYPYDVSLGDLSKMRATLQAAVRAGHVKSRKPVGFWVTEFSWDSNPPDPCAVPMTVLERWIPEAFYRMWANGIDSITWFQLMDDPLASSFYQSGLFFNAPTFAAAQPKPDHEAFRFPFVALRRGGRVYVWAHTPFGKRGRVAVQQTFKGGWTQVAKFRTDRYGIVQATLKAKPVGQFRAILRSTGEKSLPFSMQVPPDAPFNPFGTANQFEPNEKSCP
jgi:hypothetical protein